MAKKARIIKDPNKSLTTYPNGKRRKKAVFWLGYGRSGKDTHIKAITDKEPSSHHHLEMGKTIKDHLLNKEENDSSVIDGNLAADSLAIHLAKRWIFRKITEENHHQEIHLNGIPRNPQQVGPMVDFLNARGYYVVSIFFTTPVEVCESRPKREGRFEDYHQETIQNRIKVFKEQTLKVPEKLAEYGISKETNRLLEIDNSNMSLEETSRRIINFLGLSFEPKQMFPLQTIGSKQEAFA